MKMAVSCPNVGPPAAIVDLAQGAESAGWDGFFVWDHVHLRRDLHLDVHDPWVLLGAVAALTDRMLVGTLVTPLARRRPWIVAKEVATLDHLSAGRAVLGVGLGIPAEDEFGTFGDPTDDVERAERLDEGLAIVDAAWKGEPFVFEGRHHRVDAELRPATVQQPRPPVWVAGLWPNKRPMRRATQWDGIVPLLPDGPITPDALAEVLAYTGTRAGWDVVASGGPGHEPAEFAAAGATWYVESAWPQGDWWPDLRERVLAGPQQ
jgi:hypothetical protein